MKHGKTKVQVQGHPDKLFDVGATVTGYRRINGKLTAYTGRVGASGKVLDITYREMTQSDVPFVGPNGGR